MPESYLSGLLEPLLSKPEELSVSSSTDDMGLLLSVQVAREDMGTVVGKKGETANAVRHLCRVAGFREGKRVSVKILEPNS